MAKVAGNEIGFSGEFKDQEKSVAANC